MKYLIFVLVFLMVSTNLYSVEPRHDGFGQTVTNTINTLTGVGANMGTQQIIANQQQQQALQAAIDELSVCNGLTEADCLTEQATNDFLNGYSYEGSDSGECSPKEIRQKCVNYRKAKTTGGKGAMALNSILGAIGQLGGGFISGGNCSACKDIGTDAQVTRCLCNTTGKDGQPCLSPYSKECAAVENKSCAEQLEGLSCGTDCAVIQARCECGERNSYDPQGGWHVDDEGHCVNINNNNNTVNDNEVFNGGYDQGGRLDGNSYGNSNNDNGTGSKKDNKTGSTAGKGSLSSSLGLPAAGAKNDNSKKDKTDLSSQIGPGAGKASNATAGSVDSRGGGYGSGQDFRAKKGEKPKDIAKADGDSIFALVSKLYKGLIDADALDSVRSVKNVNTDKKSSIKKQKVKRK